MNLIHQLLDPWTWFLLLAGLSFLFNYLERKKLARLILGFLVLILFLIVVSPLSYQLTFTKERLYPPLDLQALDTSMNYNIIILGAGKTSDPELPYLTRLSGTVQKRLVEGVRVYRQFPKVKIIGSANSGRSNIPQARTVTEAAVELAVLPQDTFQLPSSYNTQSEAQAYLSRFGVDNNLILVTSALHMQRAVYWFERYEIEPIPAPCDYLMMEDPEDPICKWCPNLSKIDMLGRWIHEYVGLIWAKQN